MKVIDKVTHSGWRNLIGIKEEDRCFSFIEISSDDRKYEASLTKWRLKK